MTASPAVSSLEAALRAALPDSAVSREAGAYAVDGMTPALVACVASVEQVSHALRDADEAGAAVVPWGSGGRMSLGSPPARYDLALDLRGLNAVLAYEPADLTVTVEAGMLLSELQALLGKQGQWLPFDPPDGTIGGLLASNDSGPARIAYGTARDLVIGLQAVTAAGDLIKSGGRVVKNVAGYDMAKLHIGGLGTLGVIVEVTFKTAPLPRATSVLVLEGALASLMSTSLQLRDHGLAVNGMTLNSGTAWRMEARLAGSAAAVERSEHEVASLAAAAGLALVAPKPTAEIARSVRVKISVRPLAVPAVCEALLQAGAAVSAHPTAGIVRGGWVEAPATEVIASLRRQASKAGGALVLEQAPFSLKQGDGVWGEPPASFTLMRRLKEQLDPRATLNPGRFVGGI